MKTTSKLMVFMLTLLFAACGAPSRPSTPNLTVHAQIGGEVQGIAVNPKGDRLFVAIGPSVDIVDVSDPSQPKKIGSSLSLGDEVKDIHVTGDGRFVFVALEAGGVRVLDVDSGKIVAAYNLAQTEVYINGVTTYTTGAGGTAFFSLSSYNHQERNGVAIVDLAELYAQGRKGAISTTINLKVRTNDIKCPGFLSANEHYVVLVGVDDCEDADKAWVINPTPFQERIEKVFTFENNLIHSVEVVSDTAFLLGYGSLQKLDLQTMRLAAPYVRGPAEVACSALTVEAKLAYAMCGQEIVVVSTETMQVVGTLFFEDEFGIYSEKGVVVRGGIMYVVTGDTVSVYDVRDLNNYRRLGSYGSGFTGHVYDAEMLTEGLLLVAYDDHLTTYDISNPVLPRILGTFFAPEREAGFRFMTRAEDRVYVMTEQKEILELDIAQPGFIKFLRKFPLHPDIAFVGIDPYLRVFGVKLAYTGWKGGMVLYDLTPREPVLLTHVISETRSLDFTSRGEIVRGGIIGSEVVSPTFTREIVGLELFSSDNRPQSTWIQPDQEAPTYINVRGENVYFVTGLSGHIYNMTSGTEVGRFTLPRSVEDFTVSPDGKRIYYILPVGGELYLLDASDPQQVRQMSGSQFGRVAGYSYSLKTFGEYVLVSSLPGGVTILR